MSADNDGGIDGTGRNPTITHPVVPILLGIVVVIGGGYLYYSGMQASANAESVEATVVSSTVVDNGNTGNEDRDEYTVRVEYEYAYDGTTYTSENFCPGAGSGCKPSSDFRTEMEEFLADYPDGGAVTAYVPPDSPGDAYLVDTGPSATYLFVAGFGVLLVALGGYRLRGE